MFTFFNSRNRRPAFTLIASLIALCLDSSAVSASVTPTECPNFTELTTTDTAEGFVAAGTARAFRVKALTPGVLRFEIETDPIGTRLQIDSGPCADTTPDFFVLRRRGPSLELAVTEPGTVTLRLQAPDRELAYFATSSFEAATVTEEWVGVGIGDHWYQGFETRLERSAGTLEHDPGAPLARRALLEQADATASPSRLQIVRTPRPRQRTLARITWTTASSGSFHKVEDEPNDPDPDGGASLAGPGITGEITLGQKVEDEPNDPDPDGGAFLAGPSIEGDITLGQKVEDEPNDPDPDGGAFLAGPSIEGDITLGQKVEDEPNDPDPDGDAFFADGSDETSRRIVYSSLPGWDDDEQALYWLIGVVASDLGSERLPEGGFRLHGYGSIPNEGIDR